VKITLVIIALLFTYGTIATLFLDSTIAGGIGQTLGLGNIKMFGYFAYADFVLLYIFIFLLFTSSKARKSLDFYLGWMLSLISILFLQAMVIKPPYNGFVGSQVVDFLEPFIGRAGLWILWLMIFSLTVVFVFGELFIFKKIPIKIENDLIPTTSKPTQDSKQQKPKRFKNPFETPKEPQVQSNDYEDITPQKSYQASIKETPSHLQDSYFEKETLSKPMSKPASNPIQNSINDSMSLDDISDDFYSNDINVYEPKPKSKATIEQIEEVEETPLLDEIISEAIKDEPLQEESILHQSLKPKKSSKSTKPSAKTVKPTSKASKQSNTNVEIVSELEENSKILNTIEKGKIEKPTNFKLPPLDFLQPAPKVARKINEAEIDRKIEELLTKLQMFKVEGDVIRTYSGPLVTTFEFKPAPNVKVSKILGLQDDLAMALRAETIRIQAPIPGRDVVGIEIPNESIETIYLREILESKLFQESKSPLTVALGKDIVGNPFITDIKKLPHLLIAGTTGSGKSVGINAMILSLLYRNDPDHLKLMLIDPKMLEFSMYDDIPHLITPVIIEPAKAIAALANMVGEMERRYKLMAESRTKTIDNYNEKVKKDSSGEPFPYIVVVIDELADLMMNGGKEVELSIARLAQKSRACGIHLIVATQRPSVDVVTGLIKANLPSRLSYRVGQKIDSKVILDSLGAESLLGRGDGLFTPPGTTGLVRIHAPWNSEDEIEEIVEFLKAQRAPEYDESYLVAGGAASQGNGSDSCDIELDPLFEDAKQVVLTDKKTSISYLQRKLQIGYNRSANIIDQLEAMGILSAPNAKGNREIIV
jgi:S-DNA-T family DNA segregation ATPase FtsK/SpoIIIE